MAWHHVECFLSSKYFFLFFSKALKSQKKSMKIICMNKLKQFSFCLLFKVLFFKVFLSFLVENESHIVIIIYYAFADFHNFHAEFWRGKIHQQKESKKKVKIEIFHCRKEQSRWKMAGSWLKDNFETNKKNTLFDMKNCLLRVEYEGKFKNHFVKLFSPIWRFTQFSLLF
jgi:hypothetical protein